MQTVRSLLYPIATLALLGCSLFCATASAEPKSHDERTAERADALYEQGKFTDALDSYLQLARKGDPFSQYRASYMNLLGEGTHIDYPEAFAWAVLAAENDNPQLQQYYTEVRDRVPESQHDEAQARAEEYMGQWGKLALAIEASKKADRKMRGCTGSRLGTRCDEVYAVQMPKFWAISPGVGDGTDGGSASPSGSVSAAQTGAGGEQRDAEYFAQLREQKRQLDRYISEQSGHVEIGELEVIEDGESE